MSNASETPETDAAEFRYDETGVPVVASSVARSIERSRNLHYSRCASLLLSGALDSVTGRQAQEWVAEYVNQRARAERSEAEAAQLKHELGRTLHISAQECDARVKAEAALASTAQAQRIAQQNAGLQVTAAERGKYSVNAAPVPLPGSAGNADADTISNGGEGAAILYAVIRDALKAAQEKRRK